MKRFAMDRLIQWKNEDDRKPLIIEGAKQVGKTWLMIEFGRNEYEDFIYINFNDADQTLPDLFFMDLNFKQKMMGLETYFDKKIHPGNTLIILDEIQKMPQIFSFLKCIYDDSQDYYVICASSRMDTASCSYVSSLAGKVEFLKLYPMSFQEFFTEIEKNENCKNFLLSNNISMRSLFRKKYVEGLKQYFFVGGMPEAVLNFSKTGDLGQVKKVHKKIIIAYEHEFSQYLASKPYGKINMIWKSIPSQLKNENKKFFYKQIQEGSRAQTYDAALNWLICHGVVHKVNRSTCPKIPLKEHMDLRAFKLFMPDVGILSYMLGLQPSMISKQNYIFSAFEGALTEQYVVQQLVAFVGSNVCYYTNKRSACEINCLIERGSMVVPIDIRGKVNLKAKKLKTFQNIFSPEISVQLSIDEYRTEKQLLVLPLFAVEKLIMELDNMFTGERESTSQK